ncbi:MAG: translation initiation factor IF-2 [Deltaproteobacteria bacterium]|nr:translation initiation factor IF-2 [Deltaproteobacteria bacterium]
MSKKRIYELAKELNVECKQIIDKLEVMKIKGKSPSSTIDDDVAEKIAKLIKPSATNSVAEESPVGKIKEVTSESGETALEVRVTKGVIRRRTTPPPAKPVTTEAPAETSPQEIPEVTVKGDAEKVVAAEKTEKSSPTVGDTPPAHIEKKLEVASIATPATTVETAAKKTATVENKVEQKTETSAQQKTETVTPAGKKRLEVMPDEKKPSLKKILSTKAFGKKDGKGGKVNFAAEEEERARERRKKRREDTVTTKARPQKTVLTTPKQIKRRIKVGNAITVAELAKRMGIKASEVIAKLVSMGMMLSLNQSMDKDVATIISGEFGFQVEAVEMEVEEMLMPSKEVDASKLRSRAPVVTVMGHVDHGKTSLLDAIRKTNVIDGEAGGITQAIGAYHVSVGGRDVVFLDTPGHEAFTAMRARGAQVTDIVVLVVAADDGVKETTVEAINHARSANVPILIAVNKIDKPNSDIDKIKRELSNLNLVPEDWGGQTVFCPISAKNKEGIDSLLEMILLQADMLELKANPQGEARGVIIEAKIDRGRGPVATVLIQEGTLKAGDTFVSKAEYGKVRALIDDKGKRIKSAGPSMPVEVIGFSTVPQVGNEFACMQDDKKARAIAEHLSWKERERELSASTKITLEQLYQKIQEGTKELNVILKGDVQGSVEAIKDALGKLDTIDIKVKLVHFSTGSVTETDVMLASAANAVIIGFNVAVPPKTLELAQKEGVEIKNYDIIYNVINDIKDAMLGLLEPTYQESVLGKAQVRQVFRISKIGTIAGCYVAEGKIVRNCLVRISRDGKQIYQGKLTSLKRMKDDAKEVAAGYECGLSVDNFNDINENDILEAYIEEKVVRKSL